jgi:inositol-phosphate phosphatase/L-galactose 1-phosphate phosphatase/histidinol-phosphatase
MTLLPEFSAFAHELADTAGAVIRPYFRQKLEVEAKGDASPVTVADREAEQALRGMIATRYPDHGIWGEEFGPERMDAKYVWVLDPIDGTKSFMAGVPVFGTLISLARLGVPVLGVIDQPILSERWIGVAGQGTLFNGKPVTTRLCPALPDATLATTSPYLFADDERAAFERVRRQARYTLYGYDCYAYAQLAGGFIDAVVESGLKPHDFCALRPVVEGAGGVVTDWEGKALTLASTGRVVAAGDAALHMQVLQALN